MKYIIVYFIGINLLGFFCMYLDKRKAIKNKRRIKESTLWKVAILGGAVGTSLGMNIFKHKTKRKVFSIGFPLLAFVDIALLVSVAYLFR